MARRFGFIHRVEEDCRGAAYGGNLEVCPPIPGFPLGRIVVGEEMWGEQKAFLKAQRVQAKKNAGGGFDLGELYADWLYGRHIDEFMAFVPYAPQGWPETFKVVLADPCLAQELLEGAPPEVERPPDYAPVFYATPSTAFQHGLVTGSTEGTLIDTNANPPLDQR